jgi:hypothetical protein
MAEKRENWDSWGGVQQCLRLGEGLVGENSLARALDTPVLSIFRGLESEKEKNEGEPGCEGEPKDRAASGGDKQGMENITCRSTHI